MRRGPRDGAPTRARWRPHRALAAAAVLLAGAAVALAAGGDLDRLFREGRYGEARREAGLAEPAGEHEELLSFLLRTDPDEALLAARDRLRDEPSPALRLRLSLETAWIEFSRSRYEEALALLEPLEEESQRSLPGEVHLLAGMAQRALGRQQRAREELAAVKPGTPAFVWARYYLGAIALDAGDAALARHYFDSAERSPLSERMPLLRLGRWEAARREGDPRQAEREAEAILREHPGSLAALVVGEAEAAAAQEAGLPPPPAAGADSAVAGPAPAPTVPEVEGRYALQLAAFGDRSRALAFLARWQPVLPDLRLVTETAPDGRILHKVRLGRYETRAEAQAAAERLRRAHGLEVMVAETLP